MGNEADISAIPEPYQKFCTWEFFGFVGNEVLVRIISADGWSPLPRDQAEGWRPGGWFLDDGRQSIGIRFESEAIALVWLEFPGAPLTTADVLYYGFFSQTCFGLSGQLILANGEQLDYPVG